MLMYYGSFTVTVEATSEEELQQKMDKLAEELTKIEKKTGIDGFSETENTWEEEL